MLLSNFGDKNCGTNFRLKRACSHSGYNCYAATAMQLRFLYVRIDTFFCYSDPQHNEWAHTFIGALIELQQYCKEFHPMGVSWAS